MKSRAWLWPVFGILIAALAWWVLDQDNAAGPLEEDEQVLAEESQPSVAEAEGDGEREREVIEAEPAEHDHGHGATGFGFGDLVEAVQDQVWKEPRRTLKFSGRVLADGVPVPGAEVHARESLRWGGELEEKAALELLCNAAGEFSGELEVRTSVDLELIALAPNLLPKDKLNLTSEVPDSVDGLELMLFPAAEFLGSVTDQDGRMIEGATVDLSIHNRWERRREGKVRNTTYHPVEYEEQVTGPDGQFAYQVPQAEYQANAKHEEHGEASLWKVKPEDGPHELVLKERPKDPTSRIVGRVHGPDGRPIAGAQLVFAVNGPRTEADENGEFVLDGVKKHWAIEPELLAWAPGMTPAGVPLGELTELVGPVRIDLQRGAVIAGRVVDADGDGVRGAQLRILGLREFNVGDSSVPTLLSAFGKKLDRMQANEDGSFRFDALPVGQYTLVVGQNPFDPEASAQVTTGQEDLEIVVGELNAPGVTVSGEIVASGGAPLVGVRVEANRVQRSGTGGWSAGSVRSVKTDENGAYVMEDLVPGEYYFEAILEGYARGKTKPVVEKIGEKKLDFVLYAERSVLVSVVDDEGKPVAGASVTIRDATGQDLMIWSGDGSARSPGRTDDNGELLAHRMPGGPVTVVVKGNWTSDEVVNEYNWSADIEHKVEVVVKSD